jgi:hypothetical protein
MKGESLRCLPADTREPRELGDQLLDRAHRSERRWKGELRHLAHLGLQHLGGTALGFGHRSQDQITEELGVMGLENGGIDPDVTDSPASIGRHPDHTTPGRGLDGAACELGLELLQPALHLLAKLEELLKICHAFR